MTKDYRLSIQSDSNGFSFSVVNDLVDKLHFLYQSDFSNEIGHYDLFLKNTSRLVNSFPLLSSNFEKVNIIYDTCKYALIPKHLYKPEEALFQLSKLHKIDELDEIDTVEISSESIIILFAVDSTFLNCIKEAQPSFRIFPSIYPMISEMPTFKDYNKICFHYQKGMVHIVAAEGPRLVFCNSFSAMQFNTALYFLFLVLKQVQFNPEQTTVFVSGNLKDFEIMDISKYFSRVKYFRNPEIPLGSPDHELKYSSLTFNL